MNKLKQGTKQKQVKKTGLESYKVSKELTVELERMLCYAPPQQLNRTLRNLFMGYF